MTSLTRPNESNELDTGSLWCLTSIAFFVKKERHHHHVYPISLDYELQRSHQGREKELPHHHDQQLAKFKLLATNPDCWCQFDPSEVQLLTQ
jgi:hypothetical protein